MLIHLLFHSTFCPIIYFNENYACRVSLLIRGQTRTHTTSSKGYLSSISVYARTTRTIAEIYGCSTEHWHMPDYSNSGGLIIQKSFPQITKFVAISKLRKPIAIPPAPTPKIRSPLELLQTKANARSTHQHEHCAQRSSESFIHAIA